MAAGAIIIRVEERMVLARNCPKIDDKVQQQQPNLPGNWKGVIRETVEKEATVAIVCPLRLE